MKEPNLDAFNDMSKEFGDLDIDAKTLDAFWHVWTRNMDHLKILQTLIEDVAKKVSSDDLRDESNSISTFIRDHSNWASTIAYALASKAERPMVDENMH